MGKIYELKSKEEIMKLYGTPVIGPPGWVPNMDKMCGMKIELANPFSELSELPGLSEFSGGEKCFQLEEEYSDIINVISKDHLINDLGWTYDIRWFKESLLIENKQFLLEI